MRAITNYKYGTEQVLILTDVQKPSPKPNELLIKIKATSLNASDVENLVGKPAYIRFVGPFKPSHNVLGSDIAGIVEAVGENVTQFKMGDEVMGDVFMRFGGLADYVCAFEKNLILKPKAITFAQAAAIPQAAVVALQGLLKGNITDDESTRGKKVLINGAGGGAGSFAIQLANLFGAKVTAVDNASKLSFMRSLGACFVIDYRQQDYALNGQNYDLVLDLLGTRKASQVKRALAPDGQYVLVGGNVPTLLSIVLSSVMPKFGKQKVSLLMHAQNQADMAYMVEYAIAGEVLPVIEQTYPLAQTADAFAHLISGKAKGKLVIII